jgi:hypothetical protein
MAGLPDLLPKTAVSIDRQLRTAARENRLRELLIAQGGLALSKSFYDPGAHSAVPERAQLDPRPDRR